MGSFCDSNQLFICGVDDSKRTVGGHMGKTIPNLRWISGMSLHHRQHHRSAANLAGTTIGNLKVHVDGAVRHVGSAMVIFDETKVAPLFVATLNDSNKESGRVHAKHRFQRSATIDLAATGSPNKVG